MGATVDRPNIVLITTDQQRFDAMGLVRPEGALQTPTLDALARNGVFFRNAYTTCPVCIPARRSLLSGLHPATHGLRRYADGLEWDAPLSLPALLRDHGYQTQLVGKLHLHPQRKRYGYEHMVRVESSADRWDTPLQPVNDWADWMRAQGYEHPCDIGIHGNGRLARPWDKPEHTHLTSWLADRAVDFVTRYRDPSQPFFLHLSFVAPHPPLTPPQAYWDRYFRRHDERPAIGQWVPQGRPAERGLWDDAARGPFRTEEIQDAMAGYWGSVHHVDDRIRYVLTRLFEYGSPRAKEPTLLVFTSDHGEMLGDHHLWRKSLPYEGSTHIPLLMAGWGLGDLKPAASDALVCLEDVVATVLDRVGIDLPAPLGNGLDGGSLLPILRGLDHAPRRRLFGECGGTDHHYVVEDGWKYIWFPRTDEEQLFHLVSDPHELCDRSGELDRVEPFRRHLAAHLGNRDDVTFDPARLTPCQNRPPLALWG